MSTGESSERSLESGQALAGRLASIDIYRGMVMFLMLAETLHLGNLMDKDGTGFLFQWLKSHGWLEWLHFHTTHVAWRGGSLHDMIQPGFSFLVGLALPFSLQSRKRKSQSLGWMIFHAFWRSVLLIALGIFLRSLSPTFSQTNFTFDDTLTQIGLGYFFLFLIAMMSPWISWTVLSLILVGYFLAFALYPLPSVDLDLGARGVSANWEGWMTGWQAHWNKNVNFASDFDRWFLNLFPRMTPFEFHRGGYATLSFVPTLGTMLLGLLVGRWVVNESAPTGTLRRIVFFAVVCMGIAWGLDAFGICPIVKRIWTPSWTLWSGGICMLWFGALHWLVEVRGWSRWGAFWVVIGANSIAAYVMEWTLRDWLQVEFVKHLGTSVFDFWGEPFREQVMGLATLLVIWFILFWMYRRRIFLKI